MRRITGIVFLLPILVQAGCVGRLFGGEPTVEGAKGKIPLSQLEPLVDGFAEREVTLIAEVCEAIERETTVPEERRLARRIKLQNATTVYDVVTQPEPLSRLANLYLLVELAHLVWVEEGLAAKMFGERGRRRVVPAIEEIRSEMSILADLAMKPELRREFDALIREWRARNPDVEFFAGIRFGALLEASRKTLLHRASAIFDVIDPMGATSETVEGARLLGDRAFYYSKRLLKLADWQTEAAVENVLSLPEVQAIPAEGRGLIDHLAGRVAAVLLLLFALMVGYRIAVVRWIKPPSRSHRPPTAWESRYGSPT